MSDSFLQDNGNEELWRTIFQDGHPDLTKQQWIHRLMPTKPRCRLCFSPFAGFGGWWQKTFRHRAPSSRNPNYCAACDEFLNKFPGGADVDLSLLFIDIRHSTEFATHASPAEVNNRVNAFLDQATQAITDHDGFIMAFYGDCIVAVWPPGFCGQNHAAKAVECAAELTKHFSKHHDIPVGVGVHTGSVFMATVQAAKGLFRDVSIFGSEVILAARLAAEANAYQALISEPCLQRSNQHHIAEDNGALTLKGFDAPIQTFRIGT
ncbi:adenylate/guanylate cyclase domain-containing protein [Reinekea forsetii]|nr:adenylate/guanylate cyclase domain-containing protein [Reinekea forsetii]